MKKEAATFLVAGMGDKNYYVGELLAHYDTIIYLFDSLRNAGNLSEDPAIITNTWADLEKRYGKLSVDKMEQRWDSRTLTSKFLIKNLELAFKAWQSAPGYISKDFTDFCEYVLPYRAGNEPPEEYREHYYNRYVSLCTLAKDSVEKLVKEFDLELRYNQNYRFSNILWKYPVSLPVSKIEKGRRGACRHMTVFYALIMRACGLPIAIDYVNAWGNRSQGHDWNVLLLDSGKIYPFNALESKRISFVYKPAKIFRKRYSFITDALPSSEDIPSYLVSSNGIDVTSQYGTVYDITVPCTYPWLGEQKKQYAVICVFDNMAWKPVYWGKIENNNIYFQRMMGDVCYLAAYYDKGKIIPASDPFILQQNGKIAYPNTQKRNINMTLKRKYPRFQRMEQHALTIRRSKVFGANDKSFLYPTLLFDIMRTPVDIVDSLVSMPKAFRYVKIEPAVYRTGNFAEIEFFGKRSINEPEQKLIGKLFGFPALSGANEHPYTYAMDGDYETYFSKGKNEEGYVAVDFGSPYYITKVRFCPRSDTNFIIPGNTYELCYWDGGIWKSAGSKVAADIVIQFENIPAGTFYILHNLTKGTEERIFTYENNEQIWW